MTGPLSVPSDRPIQHEEELLETFAAGAKPESAWGVGLEYERLGLDETTGRAVPYSGGRGVERLLRSLSERYGWEPEREDGRIIGLKRGGARVSLEPGGQVELSGGVHGGIGPLAAELAAHLRETAEASAPLAAAWVAVGLHPFTRVEEVEWVPKGRYAVMAPFLGARGALAHHMMKATAGCQLNFDYAGEEDAAEKIRVATAVSSVVTAAYANSPLHEGRPTGFLSRRSSVWLDTDPARCGLLTPALDPGFSFRRYLDYALDVPVMFAHRLGRYLPLGGIPFRTYLRDGRGALRATLGDWALHLTTIFTEVRLKTYLEVRGADSVAPGLTVALAALWKGILYDGPSRRRAWDLVAAASPAERLAFHAEVCRAGPSARLRGATAGDLAAELVRLAREGLDRTGTGEASFLVPLEESLAEEGRCPAARLLADWEGPMRREPAALVERAAAAERRFLAALPGREA